MISSKCISYCKVSFLHKIIYKNKVLFFISRIAYIANNLEFFFNLDTHNWGGGGGSMQPNLSMNIKWGQMYEYLIFSKYISHKKWIKVNKLTLDYGQN